MNTRLSVFLPLVFATLLFADGLKDNMSENVRSIPPAGIPVPDAVKQELEAGLKSLGEDITKLPDWAVIDISKPITSRHPGGIADAGFFDEQWKIPEK